MSAGTGPRLTIPRLPELATPANHADVPDTRPQAGESDARDSTRAAHRHVKTLAARRDQIREARQFFAALLDGCPAADDSILVLSELATNAVVHSASAERSGTFTISVEISEGKYVRIEARDDGGRWNQSAQCDGRSHGLDIVASLATDYGVSGDPLAGWTAWAVIGWTPQAATTPVTTNGNVDDYD